MCGEHSAIPLYSSTRLGSSPHVRGALRPQGRDAAGPGIIPACAGSTVTARWTRSASEDHPRMCGEHFCMAINWGGRRGSSPHVRGAPDVQVELLPAEGIIPACAGSTTPRPPKTRCVRDHPRMCGEHGRGRVMAVTVWGSSPHVRGAPFENSIIPRKRKDNWLFSIQFRFENFLAFRYLLALLHPFLGVPTKDPSFASLGRLINCNPSQSTGDQSAPYTLKAICCSFLAE